MLSISAGLHAHVATVEEELFVQGRNIAGAPTHTIFTRNAHVQTRAEPIVNALSGSANASNASERNAQDSDVIQSLDGLDVRTGLELLSDVTLERLTAERAAAAQYEEAEDLATRTLDESIVHQLPNEEGTPPAGTLPNEPPADEAEAQEGLSSAQQEWVARTIVRLKREIDKFKKPKVYRKGFFKIQAPVLPEASSNASSTRVDPDSLVLMDIFVWLPLHLNGRPAGGFLCPRCNKGPLISHGKLPSIYLIAYSRVYRLRLESRSKKSESFVSRLPPADAAITLQRLSQDVLRNRRGHLCTAGS